MTIIEAIKKSNLIKRPCFGSWIVVCDNKLYWINTNKCPETFDQEYRLCDTVAITKEYILADDWIIEEKKIELTESQYYAAITRTHQTVEPRNYQGWFTETLKKELGF